MGMKKLGSPAKFNKVNDSGGYYISDKVEGVLQEVGATLGGITGALVYRGTYCDGGSGNYPVGPSIGDYYISSCVQTLDDGINIKTYQINDAMIWNGITWDKIDNTTNLEEDLAPKLGGNLDTNGHNIVVKIGDKITLGQDPVANLESATKQYVDNNSINNVVEDTTPQLGGNLDTNGKTFNEIKVVGTTKNDGYLYTGAVNPTNISRLNYDGYFHATKVFGAVYNDFADFWHLKLGHPIKFGYVYMSLGKDCVVCNKRNSKASVGICSDTYGSSVGYSNGKLPLAVAGFTLAFVDKIYEVGTDLVANDNGKLTKARFWEKNVIAKFLYKPSNLKYKDVEINGRCWVKIH